VTLTFFKGDFIVSIQSVNTLKDKFGILHLKPCFKVVSDEIERLRSPGCASHQLQDAFLSVWANISKECLVESMPLRIKTVLKMKGGQTQY